MTHLLISEWVLILIWGALGGFGGTIVLAGLIALLESLFTPAEATSIAIFGSRTAGKTTLWDQLRGEFKNRNYIATSGAVSISEFTIEYKGVKKTIKKTADFSGDNEMVKRYNELIEAGTFIYYLIDLTELNKYKKETRSRLQKISHIVREKNLNDKAGCRLIGTHYREYYNKTGKSRDEARRELIEVIGLNNIKDANIEDSILILELTESADINFVLDQIIN